MKLYADEPGHEAVRALGTVVASALARVEVPSALWRKRRDGGLGASEAALLTRAFAADIAGPAPRIAAVAIDPVLERAAALAATHGLRSGDAIQLAAALAARDADPRCSAFACFDAALRDAAASAGFSLVPARP